MKKSILIISIAAFASTARLIAQVSSTRNVKPVSTAPKKDSIDYSTYIVHCDEIPASFPGGADAWKRFVEKYSIYPDSAVAKMTQGIVRVHLTVNTDGNLTDIKALNDPGDGLAEEAVRVIKASPKWIPAKLNGKPVPYSFTQNITFGL